MKLRTLEKIGCIRTVVVLAMGMLAVSSAHAGVITVTITGNWGSHTTGPGISTLPFDNGSAFSLTTTIASLTPISFDSGGTQLAASGGSYTNGATVPFTSFEEIHFLDPAAWSGGNFSFAAHDVYTAGDMLEVEFNGPLLFGGTTAAPTFAYGSYHITEDTLYGDAGFYLAPGAGYSYVNLTESGGTLTLSSAAPEPSTGILMTLALGTALLLFRSRTSKSKRSDGSSAVLRACNWN
jgi:hypothetical protein